MEDWRRGVIIWTGALLGSFAFWVAVFTYLAAVAR